MTDTELNEAVARRLGWTNFDKGIGGLPEDKGTWEGALIAWPPAKDVWEKVPDYAGSMEAAWEIVEFVKVQHNEYPVTIRKIFSGGYGVRFGQTSAKADTASLAICLAFLKLEDK